MFKAIDREEGPLNAQAAKQVAQMFPSAVAHMLILRRARNLCWIDWHTENRTPFERHQSQLAYKILRHIIEVEITKAVDGLTRSNA